MIEFNFRPNTKGTKFLQLNVFHDLSKQSADRSADFALFVISRLIPIQTLYCQTSLGNKIADGQVKSV